ncbi:hypothetical protein [Sessilibacter corallicola]|uniref:hypothetical protein n=1 Tax=Sessilibacter corallicola TaxID=2904075 RepID=UPI001E414542|nr:hypothetical protein [Sessilibacter corallicola]MCE2029302.1 hypothetical protein [Sessilibacter corallicola]
MTVRRLTPDGDIATSSQQFISGIDEVAQTIRTRWKLFLGEYFRDVSEGTPWFQRILVKNPNPDEINAILKTRIVRTQGVIQVLRFEPTFDVQSRTYSIFASVLTQFGELSLTLDEVPNG